MLAFRVLSAMTGDSFTVRMDIEHFKVAVFKGSLATFSGIAPNDQILLIGPPYKVLDTHFGPDMCADGQKIFMFDKRIMSDTVEPPVVKLKPYMIHEPALADAPMSRSLTESSSPMLRAVPDYEIQFLSHIRRGEAFLSAVEQASVSCKRCLEQIEVQEQALDSAVSNLNDHYTATKNSFESKQQKIIVQQQGHKALLDTFDEYVQQLGDIVLHPALQTLLTNYSNLSESGDSGSAKTQSLVTLRDTIPIEKEFAWRDKCVSSHMKVEENMAQLQIIFDKISQSMSSIGKETSVPYTLAQLIEFSTALESSTEQMRCHMDDLRESYTAAVEHISSLLQCKGAAPQAKIAELLSVLEASRKSQELVIQPMEQCCAEAMRIKNIFADTKTTVSRNIYHTLKGIAAVQTDIQFKLKKGMELMTRWRQGHNGYFQHLERIRALPEAYATFIYEMIRRAKYTEEFEALVKSSVDTIFKFRSAETLQREKFMANMGSCLPPIFFEIVPSLVEKPPFFNASSTSRQQIPEIMMEDVRDFLELFGLGVEATVHFAEPPDHTVAGEKVDRISNDISNNDDSGATLTSSSSGSAATHMPHAASAGTDGRATLKEEPAEEITGGRDAAADRYANMEERLKMLEAENRELRQLVSTSLGPTTSPRKDDTGGSIEKMHGGMGRDNNNGSDPSLVPSIFVSPTEDAISSFLNSELMTLLQDVMELKELVNKCSPSRFLPAQEVAEYQLSEVANLVQEIHSLAVSVKEDAFRIKLASSEKGTALAETGSSPMISKISFLQLNVGDIALFLPTDKKDVLVAFTFELPYYYLSQESLDTFKEKNNGETPKYILGHIIFIDERIASKDTPSNIGSAKSPKNLPPGMKYHLLTVIPVDFKV